ncbi:hypothetical protein HDG40_005655 [Paraburkholderia sp. JPY158]|uniref:Uncharacterized protein n=1 Tax=Paraburkholderia atlantica TaxID=2654982 RepID=A0A7W8QD68_PARAM|nr:hypothetical protein [Paraburkholderia atlantica]MBB5427476.1 hypothetical protein [Paraburkholderia atlantica]
MGILRIKKRSETSTTATLYRNVHSRMLKRTVPVTVGSIRADTDPDDAPHSIRFSRNTTERTLNADDLAILRAWLVQHGDRKAAELRKARAQRIEQAVVARLAEQGTSGDEIDRAVELLHAAGAHLLRFSADLKTRGHDPWPILRRRYLAVHAAFKSFEEKAKGAGLTKKRTLMTDSGEE